MDDAFDISSLVVVMNRRMLDDYWVGSDVKITMFPDNEDITAVYYKFDDGEWILCTEPLVFSKDGFHRFWWYIVDDEGDISTPDSIVFNMDRTPPTINFTKEKIEENKIKFIANVSDETSGVDRVDFHVDGNLEANVSSPLYEWIYNGSGRHTVTAVVCDKAGNSNSSTLYTWRSKSYQQSVNLWLLRFLERFPILERFLYFKK
jgi:hypothetical protein